MKMFDCLKLKTIDEFAEWLYEYGRYEDSPWGQWFEESYCQKCEPLMTSLPYLNGEHECSYCEVTNKCRYFQELNETPTCKDIVKMWLEKDVN